MFSNEGNFNSKLNPLRRPKGNHQPPTPPGNGLLGSLGLSTPPSLQPTNKIPL